MERRFSIPRPSAEGVHHIANRSKKVGVGVMLLGSFSGNFPALTSGAALWLTGYSVELVVEPRLEFKPKSGEIFKQGTSNSTDV